MSKIVFKIISRERDLLGIAREEAPSTPVRERDVSTSLQTHVHVLSITMIPSDRRIAPSHPSQSHVYGQRRLAPDSRGGYWWTGNENESRCDEAERVESEALHVESRMATPRYCPTDLIPLSGVTSMCTSLRMAQTARVCRISYRLLFAVLCSSCLTATCQEMCQISSSARPYVSLERRGFSLQPSEDVERNAEDSRKTPVSLVPSPRFSVMKDVSGIDREQIRQELFRSLELTDADRERFTRLEQGSPEWLEARKNRLTGSNFGAAVGHNRYKSPAALAHDMLYGTFQGNDATRWGNKYEELACREYCLTRRSQMVKEHGGLEVDFTVTHSGLNAHPSMNWLGVSPDGHVRENGVDALLEIKCPYSQRIYPEIPPYYMDQIQGIMGVLKLPWTDFCVWTPSSMQIHRIAFDRRYWETELMPGLERFYLQVFLPAYTDREVRRRGGDMSVPPMPR